MSDKLLYQTHCTLCRQRFTHPGLVIAEGQPDDATMKTVLGLAKHIETKHRDLFMQSTMAGHEYIGLLVVRCFASQDDGLQQYVDTVRHRIHAATAKNRVPDEKLKERVDAVAAGVHLSEPQSVAVLDLLTQMRDVLQESGAFAPHREPEPVIVIARAGDIRQN
jgi:hypothetical protein